MKHILNNLTEEEKNSIREQHTGGMKVMTENFSKLLNSKLGDAKPLVNEQLSGGDTNARPPKRIDSKTESQTIKLGNNLFKLGSSEINTDGDVFKNIVKAIKNSGNGNIDLQGGASSVGGKNYDNIGLAKKRAENFKKAIKNVGITNNITILPGVVTPNTDIPNSPEANNAQFVKVTMKGLILKPGGILPAIDNTAVLNPKFPPNLKTKDKDNLNLAKHYVDVRITFPTSVRYKEILNTILPPLQKLNATVKKL
jgi:outer membrane protein OmpA-like peptidoglycan-associated protein